MWGLRRVCVEGTGNCGVGAWDLLRLGAWAVVSENLVLRVEMLPRLPVFDALLLGSPREREGGIVGLVLYLSF